MITPTSHCLSEWSRLATDAYVTGRNHFGHRFSVASATMTGPVSESVYDTLQVIYRRWLVGGWSEVESPR